MKRLGSGRLQNWLVDPADFQWINGDWRRGFSATQTSRLLWQLRIQPWAAAKQGAQLIVSTLLCHDLCLRKGTETFPFTHLCVDLFIYLLSFLICNQIRDAGEWKQVFGPAAVIPDWNQSEVSSFLLVNPPCTAENAPTGESPGPHRSLWEYPAEQLRRRRRKPLSSRQTPFLC